MKLKHIITFLFFSGCFAAYAGGLQTDPLLTGAVAAQTGTLHADHKERSKLQAGIITAEGAINGLLSRIHEIEDKTLKYLSEAGAVMDNIYQIKEAAELVVQIPQELAALGKAAEKNWQGTAVTALVSRRRQKTIADVTSLYSFLGPLVTSGSYQIEGGKKGAKVNLLNTAERYFILNTVVGKLRDICWDLRILRYNIQVADWRDLWVGLDAKSYYQAIGAKSIAENMKRKWDRLTS